MMRTRVHTLHSPEKGRKEGRKEGTIQPPTHTFMRVCVLCILSSISYFMSALD